MKTLQTYIECDLATPANTLGMGNPGEISQDTLTEPIGTAKSEIEKNKKKRKKKIKSLVESLFDKDIITKDIKFGDLIEIDNDSSWENQLSPDDYATLVTSIIYSFDQNLIRKTIKSTKWRKILSSTPIPSNDKIIRSEWFFDYLFPTIILNCSSREEIKRQINNFINSTKESNMNGGYFINKIEITPIEGLGEMTGLPRMVVFKFIINHDHEQITTYISFKKKENNI